MAEMHNQSSDLARIDPEIRERQQIRIKQLRRFNLTRVYLPIILFGLFIVAVTIFLLFLVLAPTASETIFLTVSGMADAAIILGALPLVIIFAIVLIFTYYGLFSARQRGVSPVRSTLFLFLRIESGLSNLDAIAKRSANSITRPFMNVRSIISYIRALLGQIGAIFKRS